MNKTKYTKYKKTAFVINVILLVYLISCGIYWSCTMDELFIPVEGFVGSTYILQKLVDKRNNKTNRSTYKTIEL